MFLAVIGCIGMEELQCGNVRVVIFFARFSSIGASFCTSFSRFKMNLVLSCVDDFLYDSTKVLSLSPIHFFSIAKKV